MHYLVLESQCEIILKHVVHEYLILSFPNPKNKGMYYTRVNMVADRKTTSLEIEVLGTCKDSTFVMTLFIYLVYLITSSVAQAIRHCKGAKQHRYAVRSLTFL
jgi:hypothetical protein